MYIHFDKKGTLTTQIPHGEIIRQGNDFDVFVLFDEDDTRIKNEINGNLYVILKIKAPGSTEWKQETLTFDTEKYVFKKLKVNEMTYSLRDNGLYYRASKSNYADDYSDYTTTYGMASMVVQLAKKVGSTNEEIAAYDNQYQGEVKFYVEKTLGFQKKEPEPNKDLEKRIGDLEGLTDLLEAKRVTHISFKDVDGETITQGIPNKMNVYYTDKSEAKEMNIDLPFDFPFPDVEATVEVIGESEPARVENTISNKGQNVQLDFKMPRGKNGYGVNGFEIENGNLIMYYENLDENENIANIYELGEDGVLYLKLED